MKKKYKHAPSMTYLWFSSLPKDRVKSGFLDAVTLSLVTLAITGVSFLVQSSHLAQVLLALSITVLLYRLLEG